jgi:hypothetical protein
VNNSSGASIRVVNNSRNASNSFKNASNSKDASHTKHTVPTSEARAKATGRHEHHGSQQQRGRLQQQGCSSINTRNTRQSSGISDSREILKDLLKMAKVVFKYFKLGNFEILSEAPASVTPVDLKYRRTYITA